MLIRLFLSIQFKNFLKNNNLIMCERFEIIKEDNMKFILNKKLYTLPHIYHAHINYKLIAFPSNSIIEKVMFLPEFEKNSSLIKDSSIGYIKGECSLSKGAYK